MKHPRSQIMHHSSDFALPGVERSYAPDLLLEPVHLDIALQLDVSGHSAEGVVTTTLISRSPGADAVTLDAVDLLDVVVSAPDGHSLSWSYDGQRISVRWGVGVPVGERRQVQVRYRVAAPISGMIFGGPTDGERGRFMVTDHETERARYWLPCIDHPSVRTQLDIAIRAEAGMEMLSTGALVEQIDHGDGTATTRWRCEQPCPSYLICLVVGEFVRCEDGEFNGKPIAYFALPPFTAGDLRRTFGRTGELLAFLTARLGQPLPWPKYYQFAAPGIGGAMENISLVSWDDLWMADARLREERGHILDQVNLHEMAHTWFGDLVVVRDFAHVWLKESWATYMESIWYEHLRGEVGLHEQLLIERREYLSEAEGRYVRPIITRRFDSSWSMFDRHLYPGGAVRLHLLRCELGDDVFWEGTQEYLRRYAGKVVETDDFRRVMEERSGRYLARFFDQWFASPGFPKLKAEQSYTDGVLIVRIEQTQEDAEAGIGLFDFPLQIAVEESEGTWSQHTLRVDSRYHTLRLSLPSKPLQVVIDPKVQVPHRLTFDPGSEMLTRSLRCCPWVAGRMHAAATLARSGKRAAVEAVAEAYGREERWSVRAEMARALGKAGTAPAISALVRLLQLEGDPRAMLSLTEAASAYRDPALAGALADWMQWKDRPYRAHGQALIALGSQRGTDWMGTLTAALQARSWGGWVRRGATAGLGQTCTKAAQAPLLASLTDPGELAVVRKTAAGAVAALSCELDRASRRKALEALIDTTRDPDYGLRVAAIGALGALGDAKAIPAIEAARGTIARQDHPMLERVVRKLGQAKGKTDSGKLRKQLDEVTARLHKLEQRIQDLESHHRSA